ncbi:MFS transporter [Mastigocladus laminosus UU774]|nr:MFS transporter [Mastigocladus laminosus UU774]
MEKDTGIITQPKILWLQVWSLAGVQAAIVICWLIYNLYLPKLLVGFGFPESLAVGVVILENILAVLMEPLMGALSDQAKYRVGSRFSFITLGVILSSALFIAIPSIVTFVTPSDITRWLLPLMLVAWALAMTVFRSPIFALLVYYAMPPQLPSALSVIILVGGVAGAFRGVASNFILGLGPIFTFAIGSFILLGAAATLRLFHPPNPFVEEVQTSTNPGQFLRSLALILGTGVGVALGSRLMMDALSKLLKVNLNTDNVDVIMLIINLVIAVAFLPAGALAVKIGNRLAMLIGVGVISIYLMLSLYIGTYIPVILLGICGFCLIVNGGIPFSFSLVSPRWAGLAVGMYFAGFGLVGGLFPVVFPQPQLITPEIGVWVSAIAFVLAGICVASSRTPSEEL